MSVQRAQQCSRGSYRGREVRGEPSLVQEHLGQAIAGMAETSCFNVFFLPGLVQLSSKAADSMQMRSTTSDRLCRRLED